MGLRENILIVKIKTSRFIDASIILLRKFSTHYCGHDHAIDSATSIFTSTSSFRYDSQIITDVETKTTSINKRNVRMASKI